MLEPSQEIRSPPVLRYNLCVICGADTSGVDNVVRCSKSCGYGAHDYCIDLMKKIVTCLNPSVEVCTEFECSQVMYQFKPDEVEDCVNFTNGRLTRSRGNSHRWRLVERFVVGLCNISRRRGQVNYRSYSLREQRWENDDYFCNYCQRWVGINEYDHYESWCRAIPGVPVYSSQSVYIRSRCKRFRHMIRAESVT